MLIPLLLGCAPLSLPAQAATQDALPIRWDAEPFVGSYRTRAGMKDLPGRLGRITVPERRDKETDGTVEIAFVVYKTENENPLPPMIYLVGGPGGSGTEYGAFFAKHPLLSVLDYCDVIALDQRGTGLSVPNLSEGPDLSYELPLDVALTQDAEERAFAAAAKRGFEYWQAKGVDLVSFNTRESAADIEDVRRALGLEKITLWGGSYGSHLGLAYLRDHSGHVERAVLTKVEGPDHSFKLPTTVQRHLENLSEMVAADDQLGEAIPDLVGLTRGLIEQLDEEPVTVDLDHEGEDLTITLGSFDLKRELSNAMGDVRGISSIPADLYAMSQGDWSALGSAAIGSRRSEVWSMMTVMMDMASGASPERLRRLRREAKDPANLLGDTINAPFGDLLRKAVQSPDLGAEFRSPIESDALVLFVTGRMDVRTPPENFEELRPGFPNHVYLDVTGVSHGSFEMLSPDYQTALKAFLSAEEVESQVIEINEMRFAPLGK
jgi:pimeloyl-ACP methyl ester carboxylesterase